MTVREQAKQLVDRHENEIVSLILERDALYQSWQEATRERDALQARLDAVESGLKAMQTNPGMADANTVTLILAKFFPEPKDAEPSEWVMCINNVSTDVKTSLWEDGLETTNFTYACGLAFGAGYDPAAVDEAHANLGAKIPLRKRDS